MENLNNTSHKLLTQLPNLAALWRVKEFDAAMFAAMYFFLWQIARHGPQFAARKHKIGPRPNVQEWLAVLETEKGEILRTRLLEGFERYQFRGVIANIPSAMAQWLRGAWPLSVCEEIPSPRDVLRCQARGTRMVTVLTDYPRLHEPVLNKPDAFAFFLHDLEHAYKFFYSPPLYAGQCIFFAGLNAALDRGVFVPYFDDAEFVNKFHYLISDMNTHPHHSQQYLRAILIEFYLRREQRVLTEPLTAAAERAIVEVMRSTELSAALEACA